MIPSWPPCSGPIAFCPPWPRVIERSATSASSPRERYVSRPDHSSSGCAVTKRIRVETRALLIASTVFGSDCAETDAAAAVTIITAERIASETLTRRFIKRLSSMGLHGAPKDSNRFKWPLALVSRAPQIYKNTDSHCCERGQHRCASRREEDPDPTEN